MNKNHHLIVVPGLNGSNFLFQAILKLLQLYGYQVTVFEPHWKTSEALEIKISRLNKAIKDIDHNNKLSLLGTSAGGSLVINVFSKQNKRIHKVVNVCGRLRAGKNVKPTLKNASKRSKSFEQSVLLCEAEQKNLSQNAKSNILTIRPLFDEIVPTSTVSIEGAVNKQIIAIEHMISIILALTMYFNIIDQFLTD
ncbi:MAG: hypothetical protein ACEQSA_01680 [Weeksellaceae bacterium]